jgi:hypothetical protein
MVLNPNPRPDGMLPPMDPNPPALNPEIALYFEARQRRLNVVRTTQTPSGQTLDWINVASQVFGGRIATPPPPHSIAADDRTVGIHFELDDPSQERGPVGTVPMPRKNLNALHETTSLAYFLSKKRGKRAGPAQSSTSPLDPNARYFHCTSAEEVSCVGCQTWLNVWQPYVEGSNDHSLMQLGLNNFKGSVLQSVEAGWSCDHSLNGDWAPHLFTYYTTNDYSQDGNYVGGYNSDVDGWVQVSSSIYPGAALAPVSFIGGTQYGLGIRYFVYENNWWFWVQNNANGQGEWIGYYPSWLFFGEPGESLFSTLGANAVKVAFWGEVGTASSDADQNTTQMGSGERAEEGWSRACFQKNLSIQLQPNSGLVNQSGSASADDSAKYDIKLFANSGSNWGSYFYAGG